MIANGQLAKMEYSYWEMELNIKPFNSHKFTHYGFIFVVDNQSLQ